MNEAELRAQWLKEEEHTFEGWDFSHLDGRWQQEPLRWDYKHTVLTTLKPSDKLLDMGTGGGEFLLSLNHPTHLTYATEGYMPNYRLGQRKLVPLGIHLRHIEHDYEVPFDDDLFDVVINRHESFDIKEVRRVLKSGGIFITQQVGGKNNVDLSRKLIPHYTHHMHTYGLSSMQNKLKLNDFDVLISDEQLAVLKFFDVGAVVYFAKTIEWEFPGFSVEKCFDKLLMLQKELEAKGYVETTEHRFYLLAQAL